MHRHILELSRRIPLILASGSPRRQALLSEIGCRFRIETHDVDETLRDDEPPFAYALRLAKEKALAVKSPGNSIVFGFDTIVVVDDIVLGKPDSAEQAYAMLRLLSGRRHEVCTAIAIVSASNILSADYDVTAVFFKPVTDDQIRDYVEKGEPMDKAGAYGIQGMGGFLVDTTEGNLDTVIGLPRQLLDRMCAALLETQ
jgi:septum formation protein